MFSFYAISDFLLIKATDITPPHTPKISQTSKAIVPTQSYGDPKNKKA
jgi:hypothetical protein